MKIGIIGHKRFPSNEGGIEKGVTVHAVKMAELGHDVTVYNRSGRTVDADAFETSAFGESIKNYKNVRMVTIPGGRLGGVGVVLYSFLATIHASFCHYDCVSYRASGSCAMIPLAKFLGIRVIASLHGFDSERDKWRPVIKKYLAFGERTAAVKADECLVLSENMKRVLDNKYNCCSRVISNGIEKGEYAKPQIITEKYGLEKDKYILYLGRLVPEKKVHILLETYKDTFEDRNTKLVIAGAKEGSYFEVLKDIAKNDPGIVFTGFVYGREKQELYSNAYYYASLSRVEGMPNSLLEAMSYGNCCLLSNIPEHMEVTGHNAVYCDINDPLDVKEKMRMLADDSDMVEKYKKNSSDFIIGKYNWNSVVEELLKIYKDSAA